MSDFSKHFYEVAQNKFGSKLVIDKHGQDELLIHITDALTDGMKAKGYGGVEVNGEISQKSSHIFQLYMTADEARGPSASAKLEMKMMSKGIGAWRCMFLAEVN